MFFFFRYLGIISYNIDSLYSNLYQYLSPLAYKPGTQLILLNWYPASCKFAPQF